MKILTNKQKKLFQIVAIIAIILGVFTPLTATPASAACGIIHTAYMGHAYQIMGTVVAGPAGVTGYFHPAWKSEPTKYAYGTILTVVADNTGLYRWDLTPFDGYYIRVRDSNSKFSWIKESLVCWATYK